MATATLGRNVRHATKIDLPEAKREQLIVLLNQQLANLSDLRSQAKQAHWNIKGSDFFQLHELSDLLASHLEGPIDEVAERVVTLGGNAYGTVRAAAQSSTLPEYPREISAGREHLEALRDRWAQAAAAVRKAIDAALEAGDQATADLLIGLQRVLDKDLWFLESHLQTT